MMYSAVSLRSLHKYLGMVLLLPFIAWSATALFFLLRPAWPEAYASLEVRALPLEEVPDLVPQPGWLELRYLRSILGPHLLVREASGWKQLDPQTLEERPWPDDASLRRLLEDAMQADPARYGRLVESGDGSLLTDTGVVISLDWHNLRFNQEGRDTRWINRIYEIHYLRWTGNAVLDEVLGVFALLLLILMTWTGARMLLRPARARAERSRLAAAELDS